jgi:hypothetical protein
MDDKLKGIEDIAKMIESPFDRALEDILVEYENKNKENETVGKEALSEINLLEENYKLECKSSGEDDYVDPPSSDTDYIQAWHEYQSVSYFKETYNEEIMAMHEMQIIYSYKQIEIALKKFVFLLEPTKEDRKLYNWDDIVKTLKRLGVRIEDALGYSSVNNLRQVNNDLKHSDKITEIVKKLKIKEFSGLDYFTPQSLALFHSNFIKEKVVFLNSIAHSAGLSLGLPSQDLKIFKACSVYEEDMQDITF